MKRRKQSKERPLEPLLRSKLGSFSLNKVENVPEKLGLTDEAWPDR